jgi:membrane protease YdiL (CAAX protease family)
MNLGSLSDRVRLSLRGKQLKPPVIMAVSVLTVVTWKYFGDPGFYCRHLSGWFVWHDDLPATAAVYSFLAGFMLMGVVPALIVKLVFRENLADYGVQFGHRVRTVRSFLVCAPVVVLIAYASTWDRTLADQYPLNRRAGDSSATFGLHALTYAFLYLGWEFQFRGFLQHGLRESMGNTNAVFVQVLASVLAHIGRPAIETYASILAGLFWGILAFRTRSLLSGLLQHYLLGISLDWLLCHR